MECYKMKLSTRNLAVSASLGASLLLGGCGSIAQLGADQQANKTSSQGAALADAAAQATADAEAEAQATDSSDSDSTDSSSSSELPAYLQVVQAARDYTRKLLGLSSDPFEAFKAAVEAAQALATDPADFEAKIKPAKATLDEALKTQKANADQARLDHADELQKIFDATTAVFAACGTDISLNSYGQQASGGPVVVIGNGVFPGSFSQMEGHMQRPDPKGLRQPDDGHMSQGPFGLTGDSTVDASTSAECTTATAALQALLPSDG